VQRFTTRSKNITSPSRAKTSKNYTCKYIRHYVLTTEIMVNISINFLTV
jgi:hypothetical protein